MFGQEMWRRHHIPSAGCNYGCSRSPARMCAWGNVSQRQSDLDVKIPSCLMGCAKENSAGARQSHSRKK